VDNLLKYLSDHFGDRLAVSGVSGDLLVWGERIYNGVKLLGLSFNTSTIAQSTAGHGNLLLASGTFMAQRMNVPFIRIEYPPDLDTNPNSILIIDGQQVKRVMGAAKIQALLGTRYTVAGTSKAVNRSTSDPFHVWAREALPQNYVRTDVDAIVHSQKLMSALLIEVKRSPSKTVREWEPYTADARNYYISDLLAKRARLKFVTLNHPYTTVSVTDEKMVGVYDIQTVTLSPADIQFTKQLTTALNLVTILDEMSSR
jgi:hypothetical protein